MIKPCKKPGIEGTFLYIIKAKLALEMINL
jgi:hypothetical protein